MLNIELQNYRRIVIKIGSSILITANKFHLDWLETFAEDVRQLINNNIEVIIVTSGAVALGKSNLINVGGQDNAKLSLPQKQASAAIGQIKLMSYYHDIFAKKNLIVAQILLTANDCNSRQSYNNASNTIETLLKNAIIPIINENDSVAIAEIKIGDNDRLASRVSQMAEANLLILFSDIDGLYNKNPRKYKDAKLLRIVENIDNTIEEMADGSDSSVGTGGMKTKIDAAKMANASGCDVIITDGTVNNSLSSLFFKNYGDKNFTIFKAKNCKNKIIAKRSKSKKISKTKKNWLSGVINAKGGVVINDCAHQALITKKNSLLPVGVVAVDGNFDVGEVIFIKDQNNHHIGNGIANYNSSDLLKVLEKKTAQVKEILGEDVKVEVVNLEYLIIF